MIGKLVSKILYFGGTFVIIMFHHEVQRALSLKSPISEYLYISRSAIPDDLDNSR